MFKLRMTVLRLMILVAVVGLLLASGMFAVRCYKTRVYSLQRVEELESEIGFLRNCMGNHPVAKEPLNDLEMQLREFKHVASHPWLRVPFGEDPYAIKPRVVYGEGIQDTSK